MRKTESEYIKELSKFTLGTDEFTEIFEEYITEYADVDTRETYFKKKQEIEDKEISQQNFLEENKGKEILKYDPETFMPIYKNTPKWSHKKI